MGRTPCCDKKGLKKGPWTPEEDDLLVKYIQKNGGHGSWRSLPKMAGLLRCGKSCRLRWTNYLRPNIKRGPFTIEEEKLVIQLHSILGNRWSAIASQLPGRTDNEVKNLWNTHLKKRLVGVELAPKTYEPFTSSGFAAAAMATASSSTRHMAQWESARLEAEARLSRESSLFNNPTLCKSTTDVDFFLRLWNSEVGEAFRNVKFETDNSTCQSPKSQDSISTKFVSVSAITTEVVITDTAAAPSNEASNQNEYVGKSYLEELMAESDTSSSNELGDSSDTALQLLLDFPINNDMSFLETNLGNKYATTSASLLMDNPCITPM